MSKISNIYSTLLFFAIHRLIEDSYACNGFNYKLNAAEECIPNSILKFENFSARLDADCNFIFKGCYFFAKPFTTAIGTYTVTKSPIPPIVGDIDFCDPGSVFGNDQIVKVAESIGATLGCPIKNTSMCTDEEKKIDISSFKYQLALLAGTTDLVLKLDHDTGKSCVHINADLFRVKRGRKT